MDKLAAAIVILSQGMPFIQLGQDFLRSKPRILKEGEEPNDVNIYSHDSYNAPDYTNSIKWNRKLEYKEVFEYYKALIRLRKGSPLFRMNTKEDVNAHLHFMHNDDWNCVSWKLEKTDNAMLSHLILITRTGASVCQREAFISGLTKTAR